MTRRMLLLTLGALLAATSPAVAGDLIQHSGLVVSTNPAQDTVTISEMGPWHGPGTRPVRRELRLTSTTQVRLVLRRDEPGAFKGQYVEQPLPATGLRPGDYATITERLQDGRPVVTKVEVVRPGESAS